MQTLLCSKDYQDYPIKIDMLEWQEKGLQQTVTGYGSKLTSRYKVFYADRWRRLYHTCYSNSSSIWIKVKNETIFFS